MGDRDVDAEFLMFIRSVYRKTGKLTVSLPTVPAMIKYSPND
jgi:hypothetical protein